MYRPSGSPSVRWRAAVTYAVEPGFTYHRAAEQDDLRPDHDAPPTIERAEEVAMALVQEGAASRAVVAAGDPTRCPRRGRATRRVLRAAGTSTGTDRAMAVGVLRNGAR
jgi:hypothetical protein